MATNEGADAGEQKLDGKPGSGAPEDESPDGDGKPKDGEKVIPESRLKAALSNQRVSYEQKLNALRDELEAFKAGMKAATPEKKPDAPKRYTRAELKVAVDANQITQEQADDILDRQLKAEAKEEATREALAVVSERQKKERVETEIAKYRRLKPEVMERGSEVRQRVAEEYRSLVEAGSPETEATELAALKVVLGPVEKLEKAAGARRSADHDEQGGGNDGRPKQKSGGKLVDNLPARDKDFYQKQIDRGEYKDWAAVETMLQKYASPTIRRRYGAAA